MSPLPANNQPLGTAQAGRFREARSLLQSGQHALALPIAEALTEQAPHAADAWHLLGICLAHIGRHAHADAAFERALRLLPGDAMVSRNYGLSLARHGKVLREQGQWNAAETTLRKALALVPEQPSAWVDLGVVLRLLGRVDDALDAYRRAERMLRQRGEVPPELQDAINGVLIDAGRMGEALEGARKLVAMHPGHAPAHETLSNLLWENGTQLAPDEDPLATFRTAANAKPGNRALQLGLARMLLATSRAEEALELLQPLRKREPDDALLSWFAADAFDALQEREQASVLYSAVADGELGRLPEFLNARARHAFRVGDIGLAASCAEKAVELDPSGQEGWSHLATAWRLAGDEREHWLCDYDRLVGFVEVPTPRGFASRSAFLQALAETLEAMHNATREPINQSVRGGTQTAGQLFGRDLAIIHATEAALRAAIESWLVTLPDDPLHPFLSRRRRSVDFVTSWSVRLRSSGHHSNHIHPKGWASSAFYVSLPSCVRDPDAGDRAGWIQFGQPLESLRLSLPPRRLVHPRPGYVALFPSYMWHGTVPFDGRESRLTIAFDMQPKA
ncbi:tetratricopeptide repeat protein [Luteimonas sp. SDU101]|uniref:tetratricopeptide repeat protein n=1 Tax=unclassified Luteimonas TaxID=2629088 RepID=UPI003EB8C9CC